MDCKQNHGQASWSIHFRVENFQGPSRIWILRYVSPGIRLMVTMLMSDQTKLMFVYSKALESPPNLLDDLSGQFTCSGQYLGALSVAKKDFLATPDGRIWIVVGHHYPIILCSKGPTLWFLNFNTYSLRNINWITLTDRIGHFHHRFCGGWRPGYFSSLGSVKCF